MKNNELQMEELIENINRGFVKKGIEGFNRGLWGFYKTWWEGVTDHRINLDQLVDLYSEYELVFSEIKDRLSYLQRRYRDHLQNLPLPSFDSRIVGKSINLMRSKGGARIKAQSCVKPGDFWWKSLALPYLYEHFVKIWIKGEKVDRNFIIYPSDLNDLNFWKLIKLQEMLGVGVRCVYASDLDPDERVDMGIFGDTLEYLVLDSVKLDSERKPLDDVVTKNKDKLREFEGLWDSIRRRGGSPQEFIPKKLLATVSSKKKIRQDLEKLILKI